MALGFLVNSREKNCKTINMFQRNEMKNNRRHLSLYGHLNRYFQFVLSAIESRCPVHVGFKFTKLFIFFSVVEVLNEIDYSGVLLIAFGIYNFLGTKHAQV